MTIESPGWRHYELAKTPDPSKPAAPRWLEEPVRVSLVSRGPQLWAVASRGKFQMSMCCSSGIYLGDHDARVRAQVISRLHRTWLLRAQTAERLVGLIMDVLSYERSDWRGRKDAPRGAWRIGELCERLKLQIDAQTVVFVLGQLVKCDIVLSHTGNTTKSLPWFSPNLSHISVTRMEVAREMQLREVERA